MIRKSTAIIALVPEADFSLIGQQKIIWHDSRSQPTEEEINSKIAELKAAEPMRLLRIERNRRLAETDWMANSDVVMTDKWKTYRQALRDLPATAEPMLDEQGNLINVTWPEVPEKWQRLNLTATNYFLNQAIIGQCMVVVCLQEL